MSVPEPDRRVLPASQGGDDPEATTHYNPDAHPLVSAAEPKSELAAARRFAFLSPPRAEGELGWLAHYRVKSLIGEGGIGLVFLAEDSHLSRPVALKVIKPEMAAAPDVESRFVREAQATAAIKHDNIVTIYQVGRDNGILFLAMEYLQGVSLQNWLTKGRKASVDLVLRIGRETAAGLAAAHRTGLIHRDIKPANIWLEAPTGRVKILDFGMARSERDDLHITQSGTVLGTPSYMAPEQARGETVGASADLFSLGCVLYRLCTGRLPFEGTSILAVLTALATATPRSPREVDPEVRPALDALVMRLLAKDPAKRPQAVFESIRSIERELAAERKRAGASAGAPALGDLETLQSLKAGTSKRPEESLPKARPASAGRARWVIAGVSVFAAAAIVFGLVAANARRDSRRSVANPAGLATNLKLPPRQEDNEAKSPEPEAEPPRPPQTEAVEKQGAATALGKIDAASAPSLPPSTPPALPAEANNPPATAPQSAATPSGPASADRSAAPEPSSNAAQPETKAATVRPSEEKPKTPRPLGEISKVDRHPGFWRETIDPDGDCKINVDRQTNKIRIFVPETPHLLSAEIGRLNAPRLLREVTGDFDATVRVAGVFRPSLRTTVTEYAPYHGAGILVWQDKDNYVRLEIATDVQRGKLRPFANFEYRSKGELVGSKGQNIADGTGYLRLQRRGDEFSGAVGSDGVHWTSFPVLSTKLKDRLDVGVAVINSATRPLTAQLDGFALFERLDSSNGASGGVSAP